MNKVIVQIDSTLIGKDDQPIKNMVELVRGLQTSGGRVIFISMKPESERPALYQWIQKYLGRAFENVPLYMPADNDDRREAAIVVEWLNDIKKSKNNILAVIDSRPQMRDMWAAAGIMHLGVQ